MFDPRDERPKPRPRTRTPRSDQERRDLAVARMFTDRGGMAYGFEPEPRRSVTLRRDD